jgi:hypothetical protein
VLKEIEPAGKTNLEAGMKEASKAYTALNLNAINNNHNNNSNNNLEILENNRIIFITDLLPTIRRSDVVILVSIQ